MNRIIPLPQGQSEDQEIKDNYALIRFQQLEEAIRETYIGDELINHICILAKLRQITNWTIRYDLLWTEGRVYIGKGIVSSADTKGKNLQAYLINAAHIDPLNHTHSTDNEAHRRIDSIFYWPNSGTTVEAVNALCPCRRRGIINQLNQANVPPVPTIPNRFLTQQGTQTHNQ